MKYTQIIIDFIENKQGSAKQAAFYRRDAENAEKSVKPLRILRLCGEISVKYLFPIMSNAGNFLKLSSRLGGRVKKDW